MKQTIAIIDYDAGNLLSVQKALCYLTQTEEHDTRVIVTRDSAELSLADKVVLPGVGAFADAMEKLTTYQLVDTVLAYIKSNRPFLGICLGMQLLFESSEEGTGTKGLGVLPGHILRIPDKPGVKVPQIGWNSLTIRENSRLLAKLPTEPYVYFVHSYYLQAQNRSDVAATTEYSVSIDCAVEAGNLFGCQFHPEKSGDVGLQILRNFITIER